MKTFTLGRGPEQSINVGEEHSRVSRRHAEIAVLGPGTYRITDLGTLNGTEVMVDGRWKRVSQATLSYSQRFRLAGQFESSIADLAHQGFSIGPSAPRNTAPPALRKATVYQRASQLLMFIGSVVLIIGIVMTVVQMIGEIGSGAISGAPCFTCSVNTRGDFSFETRYPGLAITAFGTAMVVFGYWIAARSAKGARAG
jgi:hypothetical protein